MDPNHEMIDAIHSHHRRAPGKHGQKQMSGPRHTKYAKRSQFSILAHKIIYHNNLCDSRLQKSDRTAAQMSCRVLRGGRTFEPVS